MGTALLNRDRYGQGKPMPKDSSGSGTLWGTGIQSDDPNGVLNPLSSRLDFDGTVQPTDLDRATDAREKGRIGIFGSALSYAGSSPRITSEPIGRDINPLGQKEDNESTIGVSYSIVLNALNSTNLETSINHCPEESALIHSQVIQNSANNNMSSNEIDHAYSNYINPNTDYSAHQSALASRCYEEQQNNVTYNSSKSYVQTSSTFSIFNLSTDISNAAMNLALCPGGGGSAWAQIRRLIIDFGFNTPNCDYSIFKCCTHICYARWDEKVYTSEEYDIICRYLVPYATFDEAGCSTPTKRICGSHSGLVCPKGDGPDIKRGERVVSIRSSFVYRVMGCLTGHNKQKSKQHLTVTKLCAVFWNGLYSKHYDITDSMADAAERKRKQYEGSINVNMDYLWGDHYACGHCGNSEDLLLA